MRRGIQLILAAALIAACGGPADTALPVATPTLTLGRSEAAIGSPMEMMYRFEVAPDAPPFDQDYWVFVHFVDDDGELMWTDDHPPPTPTRSWMAGQTIAWDRTMFVPKFPYIGEARIVLGLFSPATGERLPLAGQSVGQRAYAVATFMLRLQAEDVFVAFDEGWYDTEFAVGGSGIEWQWSGPEATLLFANPGRDVTFFLQIDQPAEGVFAEPQQVELRIGETVVDRFALPAGPAELRRIEISAAQLGSGDTVGMTLAVDRTFVPAEVQAQSGDTRELGVRVFRAYVQPR